MKRTPIAVALVAMAMTMAGVASAQQPAAYGQGPAASPARAGAADEHAAHMHEPAAPAAAAQATPGNEALPADEEGAKARLEKSSRHGEFIDVAVPGRPSPIKTFVVYPERKDKAPVVIVISEIFGLSDWIRGVADQLAKEGFIAVAPDMLSGKGPNGGGTESFASRDDVVAKIRELTPPDVVTILDAVSAQAKKIPSGNGKIATIGFCWGGGQSFGYAAASPSLNAAVVYYGTSPDAAKLATVKAPVLGLYGGDDARVNATIEPASAEMKKLGKSYEPHIYDGAGHGFLRQLTGREGANVKAAEQAWPATLAFLRQHTK
jgi:carboxymethylenebutenolidase